MFQPTRRTRSLAAPLFASLALTLGAPVAAAQGIPCPVSHAQLESMLTAVVTDGHNAGLSNNMWASIVDRDGVVCNVARSAALGNQWPGSRVISAQKAYTANAFSLPNGAGAGVGGTDIALSSGNLYGTVLQGGALFGLQFSNPVNAEAAYKGPVSHFGSFSDPMKGRIVGGINVFGGGLALYDAAGHLVGALGVSGDTSCTDHVVAWRVRDALGLDHVPGGISASGDDNLVIATPVTAGAFEHPDCGGGVSGIIADLPLNFPIGP